MKSASLVELLELSEQVKKDSMANESGLVVVCRNRIYCVDKYKKVLVAQSTKDQVISALAHNDGSLYAGGAFGVVKVARPNQIVSSTPVSAIASHGGVLYGANNSTVKVDHPVTAKELTIDEEFGNLGAEGVEAINALLAENTETYATRGSVYCLVNNYKTAEIPSEVVSLLSHDGRLYAAGEWQLYDALTGKPIPIAGAGEVKKGGGVYKALASYNNSIYCAEYSSECDPMGRISDFFDRKVILDCESLDISSLVSLNGGLYYASSIGGSFGVFDAMDTSSKPRHFCLFNTAITAMASVPIKLWEQMASKGKKVGR
jgi:hypothetical protein